MRQFNLFIALALFGVSIGAKAQTWNISDLSTSGNNVSATLSGTTLTISGSGNMADFWSSSQGEAPWYANRNSIQTVVFQSGSNVKNIGNRAFKDCSNLRTITIPSTVLRIWI